MNKDIWTATLNKRKVAGEYVVRVYKNGKRYPDADYFTTDWTDAVNTKAAMEERWRPVS